MHWEKGWLGEGGRLSSTRARPAPAHRSCWKAALILSCSYRSRSYKYQLSSWCSWRTARQQALQQARASPALCSPWLKRDTKPFPTWQGLPGNVLVQRHQRSQAYVSAPAQFWPRVFCLKAGTAASPFTCCSGHHQEPMASPKSSIFTFRHMPVIREHHAALESWEARS